MLRTCSQCGSELPSNSPYCAQCSQGQDAPVSPTPRTIGNPSDNDQRFPLWQVLPWTLLAAVLLLLLPLLRHSRFQSAVAMQSSAQSSAAAPPPAAMPMTSQTADNTAASGLGATKSARSALPSVTSSSVPASLSAAAVPLTVSLYSASRGKHIPVGTPVTISAYAALPPGQSATLAVSYGRDSGPRSLLTLTQGSLSSTTWTPFLPGRYLFTASALGSRKKSAFSHSLTIWADAPVPAPTAKSTEPVPIAVRPSAPKSHLAAVKVAAAKPSAPRPSAPRPSAPKPSLPKQPSVPAAYHVAAAEFPIRRIAFTLAGALRGRGFKAFVRPGLNGTHKSNYRVETGDFTRQTDADKQVRLLKQDGYPAFVFQTH